MQFALVLLAMLCFQFRVHVVFRSPITPLGFVLEQMLELLDRYAFLLLIIVSGPRVVWDFVHWNRANPSFASLPLTGLWLPLLQVKSRVVVSRPQRSNLMLRDERAALPQFPCCIRIQLVGAVSEVNLSPFWLSVILIAGQDFISSTCLRLHII